MMEISSRTGETILLPDGRKLGYAEYGAPAGKPLLYFHGWPSSRLEAKNLHAIGVQMDARIIGIDRPGLGLSDFKKGFTIRQWPNDVAALADTLGIDRFAVIGISSGAPYAMACARYISDRLTAAGSVSGVCPLDGPNPQQYVFKLELRVITVARRAPWLARLMLRLQLNQLKRNPAKFLAELDKDSPEVDKAVFREHPEFTQEFVEGLRECARQGMRGPVASIALEGQPWGFRLQDIPMKFHIWHGGSDNLAYPAAAHFMAGQIPDCQLTVFPEEAHLSTIVNRAGEIVATLMGR